MNKRDILAALQTKGYYVQPELWQLEEEQLVWYCDEVNRWLRQVKKLHVHVGLETTAKKFPMWTWRVDNLDPDTQTTRHHDIQIWVVDHWHPDPEGDDEQSWASYEEAMWNGIESCLDELDHDGKEI
jgi:hypothetical protein